MHAHFTNADILTKTDKWQLPPSKHLVVTAKPCVCVTKRKTKQTNQPKTNKIWTLLSSYLMTAVSEHLQNAWTGQVSNLYTVKNRSQHATLRDTINSDLCIRDFPVHMDHASKVCRNFVTIQSFLVAPYVKTMSKDKPHHDNMDTASIFPVEKRIGTRNLSHSLTHFGI